MTAPTTELKAELIAGLAKAAFAHDDKQLPSDLREILEHMSAQPTREGRMWRRVPVNLVARAEGCIRRTEDALAAVTAERDQARQMLADAPHDAMCPMRLPATMRIPEDTCSCWKAGL